MTRRLSLIHISNEKYPHAFGEPYTSINRWNLKLKSELLPYAYSIAEESVSSLPMIRAMFLEYPNPDVYKRQVFDRQHGEEGRHSTGEGGGRQEPSGQGRSFLKALLDF